MYPLGNILSGEWQRNAALTDYRTEALSNIVVERATWRGDAAPQQIADTTIADEGYVWLRFWLLEDEIVIEKYYTAAGQPIGYYVPIGMPLKRRGEQLELYSLLLALWLRPDDLVTVLNEDPFEAALVAGEITPVEAEHAEFRIRECTALLARKQFPPGLIRNFAIQP
jgi:predicted RNA-binding protein associated with RNAse of E/G family